MSTKWTPDTRHPSRMFANWDEELNTRACRREAEMEGDRWEARNVLTLLVVVAFWAVICWMFVAEMGR